MEHESLIGIYRPFKKKLNHPTSFTLKSVCLLTRLMRTIQAQKHDQCPTEKWLHFTISWSKPKSCFPIYVHVKWYIYIHLLISPPKSPFFLPSVNICLMVTRTSPLPGSLQRIHFLLQTFLRIQSLSLSKKWRKLPLVPQCMASEKIILGKMKHW